VNGIPTFPMAVEDRDPQDRHCEIAEWRRDPSSQKQGVVCDSKGMNFELGYREAFGSEAWVEGGGPKLEPRCCRFIIRQSRARLFIPSV
jgi:hypothetical protein